MQRSIRQFRIEGNVAFVPLTKGREAKIDAADAEVIGRHNWCMCGSDDFPYAGRAMPRGHDGKQARALMHRIIMNAGSDVHVDHISGDTLDNRRSNLRLATNAENRRNQKISKANTSGVKGVTWCGVRNRWVMQITKDGKRFAARFKDLEDARQAYEAASKKLHGDFGRVG